MTTALLVTMLITAYCPCKVCCGHWENSAKRTLADGSPVAPKAQTVAVDTTFYAFGTVFEIEGGEFFQKVFAGEWCRFTARDRGKDIKGSWRLDILVPTHKLAKEWGSRWKDVRVYRKAND